MVRFHGTLSERSVYLRYFPFNESGSTDFARTGSPRICLVDYDREIAIVAEQDNEILAVGGD